MTYAEAVAAAQPSRAGGDLRASRWRELPEPVLLEDIATVQPAAGVPDLGEPGDGYRNLLLWASGS